MLGRLLNLMLPRNGDLKRNSITVSSIVEESVEVVAVIGSVDSENHAGLAVSRRRVELPAIAPDWLCVLHSDGEGGEVGIRRCDGHAGREFRQGSK